MIKLSTRKLASVLLAGTLIVSGSIALGAAANATGKQGAACSKLTLKSGIYTCIANPLKSSPKLVWATARCITAQAAELSTVAQVNSSLESSKNAVTQTANELASYQNALTVANTQLDNILTKNMYTVDYTAATRLPIQVQGYDAAIAAHTAKLKSDTTGLALAQASLAKDVAGSQGAKNDQATINAYTLGIKYRQGKIDDINRSLNRVRNLIPRDQNSVIQWTSLATNAVSQQKSITEQFQPLLMAAKSARSVYCKTGL